MSSNKTDETFKTITYLPISDSCKGSILISIPANKNKNKTQYSEFPTSEISTVTRQKAVPNKSERGHVCES